MCVKSQCKAEKFVLSCLELYLVQITTPGQAISKAGVENHWPDDYFEK